MEDVDTLRAFINTSEDYYVDNMPMHLLPVVPDTPSPSAIVFFKGSAPTATAGEYISVLRKQHILLIKEKDSTTFSVAALVALRSYSNITSILGMWFLSYRLCSI